MSSMSGKQPISTVTLPATIDSATVSAVEEILMAALRPGARVVVDGGWV